MRFNFSLLKLREFSGFRLQRDEQRKKDLRMRFIRKRSKRAREHEKLEQETQVPDNFNQSSPWYVFPQIKIEIFIKISQNFCRKIVILLLFLAVLAVLLLRNDEPDNNNNRKLRVIPNTEVALPPSPSVLHTFKSAAVSSDSQICSTIAR